MTHTLTQAYSSCQYCIFVDKMHKRIFYFRCEIWLLLGTATDRPAGVPAAQSPHGELRQGGEARHQRQQGRWGQGRHHPHSDIWYGELKHGKKRLSLTLNHWEKTLWFLKWQFIHILYSKHLNKHLNWLIPGWKEPSSDDKCVVWSRVGWWFAQMGPRRLWRHWKAPDSLRQALASRHSAV